MKQLAAHKRNYILVLVSVVGVLSLMTFTSPTANTSVVGLWFVAIGIGLYNFFQIIGKAVYQSWTFIQSLICAVALLMMIALSSLNQLTIVDVLVVTVVALLAQLVYRAQRAN